MSGLIYTVGHNSKGKHKAKVENKRTRAYLTWGNMLRRCYDARTQLKHPTYIDCSVDKRFHDFQDFAEWFYSHPYNNTDYHLDKDLLIPDNKIYSPDACCFVPVELNLLLTNASVIRGYLPQGVSLHKKNNRYTAQLRVNGKVKYLGSFDSPNEAYQVYKIAKEYYVKEKALEWQNRIADDVFNALMNWQLTD